MWIGELTIDGVNRRTDRNGKKCRSVHRREVYQCRIPRVSADQHPVPPHVVEHRRLHEPPAGEMLVLVQFAVRGQVHFSVEMLDCSVSHRQNGVVELSAGTLFDEAELGGEADGGFGYLLNHRRSAGSSQSKTVIGQVVAGKRQFGEDEEVNTTTSRIGDGVEVSCEVCFEVLRNGDDLGCPDGDLLRHGEIVSVGQAVVRRGVPKF